MLERDGLSRTQLALVGHGILNLVKCLPLARLVRLRWAQLEWLALAGLECSGLRLVAEEWSRVRLDWKG